MRVGLFFICLLVLAAAACTGGGNADVHQRCEQVRDHLIDLRLRQAAASDTSPASQLPTIVPAQGDRPAEVVPPPAPIDLEAHRAALKQALGTRFVETWDHPRPELICGGRAGRFRTSEMNARHADASGQASDTHTRAAS